VSESDELLRRLTVLETRHNSLKAEHVHLKEVTIGTDGGNGLRQAFREFKALVLVRFDNLDANMQALSHKQEQMDRARAQALESRKQERRTVDDRRWTVKKSIGVGLALMLVSAALNGFLFLLVYYFSGGGN